MGTKKRWPTLSDVKPGDKLLAQSTDRKFLDATLVDKQGEFYSVQFEDGRVERVRGTKLRLLSQPYHVSPSMGHKVSKPSINKTARTQTIQSYLHQGQVDPLSEYYGDDTVYPEDEGSSDTIYQSSQLKRSRRVCNPSETSDTENDIEAHEPFTIKDIVADIHDFQFYTRDTIINARKPSSRNKAFESRESILDMTDITLHDPYTAPLDEGALANSDTIFKNNNTRQETVELKMYNNVDCACGYTEIGCNTVFCSICSKFQHIFCLGVVDQPYLCYRCLKGSYSDNVLFYNQYMSKHGMFPDKKLNTICKITPQKAKVFRTVNMLCESQSTVLTETEILELENSAHRLFTHVMDYPVDFVEA
ncbi:hypothetical protein RF11_00709 [Thelohanellus kitauei]|uniref:Tudor domain-containing protein n=1 Tax=Thelohanellus kitauei TaxID=669202 RepID=A0A0C2N4U3_THEKT|nr:hypothetical protein RF11_00709 [Thelohanellus kitauei]